MRSQPAECACHASPTGESKAIRAVRGAIQIDRDDPVNIRAGASTLMAEIMRCNSLTAEDIVSVIFTVTPDLTSGFRGAGARDLVLTDVPLLCATEIPVPNAMARVIRLLAHIRSDRPQSVIKHVYLGGAAELRPDLLRRDGRSGFGAGPNPS